MDTTAKLGDDRDLLESSKANNLTSTDIKIQISCFDEERDPRKENGPIKVKHNPTTPVSTNARADECFVNFACTANSPEPPAYANANAIEASANPDNSGPMDGIRNSFISRPGPRVC